jgi:hypothetical protein
MAWMHVFRKTYTYLIFFINIKHLSCIYLNCFTVNEREGEGGEKNGYMMDK